MRKRALAREYVLKILYQLEMNESPLDEIFSQFWTWNSANDEVRKFTERVVRGPALTSPKSTKKLLSTPKTGTLCGI